MKQNLFIDTNVICALYNPKDSLHAKAQNIKSLLTMYSPVVSNFVLLETCTILSQRVSKEFAVSFGNRVRQKHTYSIRWITQNLEDEVWNIFVSIKDKNFSYVDASTLTVIKKGKISHLLSFDTGFSAFQKEFKFQLLGN